MAEQETRYTFDRVVRMLLTVGTIAVVVLLTRYLSDVLIPFAAAVVLAYLLNPLVTAFERATQRRGLAVAMTLGGLGIVGFASIAIVVPLMVGQVREFQGTLGKLRDDLAASGSYTVDPAPPASEPSSSSSDEANGTNKSALGWTELKQARAKFHGEERRHKARASRFAQLGEDLSGTYIGDLYDQAGAYTDSDEFRTLLLDTAKRIFVGGWTVVSFAVSVVLGLTGLIVVLLYLVFLLMDFPHYARIWPTFLPPNYRDSIVEFLVQFDTAMRRYFRGQAVVAMIVGVLFAIGFSIVGLPMAVPFGLFIGLLNMVPYLQTVAIVPGIALAGVRAIEGDSGFLISVVLVLAVFGVVQLIQDSLLTPRIMGKATGLRPVAILLGVFIWGKLLGFLGLIMAIPLTCLGIAYYQRFILNRQPAEPTLPNSSA